MNDSENLEVYDNEAENHFMDFGFGAESDNEGS